MNTQTRYGEVDLVGSSGLKRVDWLGMVHANTDYPKDYGFGRGRLGQLYSAGDLIGWVYTDGFWNPFD